MAAAGTSPLAFSSLTSLPKLIASSPIKPSLPKLKSSSPINSFLRFSKSCVSSAVVSPSLSSSYKHYCPLLQKNSSHTFPLSSVVSSEIYIPPASISYNRLSSSSSCSFSSFSSSSSFPSPSLRSPLLSPYLFSQSDSFHTPPPLQILRSKIVNRRSPHSRFLARNGYHSTVSSLNSVSSPNIISSPTVLTAIALTAAFLSVSLAIMGSLSLSNRAKNKVQVVLGEGTTNQEICDKISLFDRQYEPALGMSNRHFETIFAAVFRTRPKVTFRRECLRMADGGTVALDWPVMGDDVELWKQPLPEDAPYLILLPGLTGGSDDTYVRHMLIRARKSGWGVVVFNSRGCADSPVTSPQFYSASYTEDLRQVIKRVGKARPEARLYAAGWSLGANILVRYLGQEGDKTPLSGAISLCNPFDLVLADKNFHIGFNNFYDQRLSVALNRIFKKHAPLFENIGGDYDIPLVARASTVREFDNGLTRVSFGYKSVDDYYYDASSSRMVKDVRIPLLCIQADDDPIAPIEGVPLEDIKANPNCILVTTPFGGHLGWVAGDDSPFGAPWTDPLTMDYLIALENMFFEKKGLKGSEKAQGEDGVAELVEVTERGEKVQESSNREAQNVS